MDSTNSLHISVGSGKLSGIRSINTPTTTNRFCTLMQNQSSVCSKCYASRYEGYRKNVREAFKRNQVLAERLLTPSEIPVFHNDRVLRFSSFGEIINRTHFKNMLAIAIANPQTLFTLWTKRTALVQFVIKREGKPSNLILIHSSSEIDVVDELPEHFDKVFSVFSKGTDPVSINCHAKCIECMVCYSKNETINIVEVVK
jgi:hypothetical protein